jgi:hypothetical protein
LISLNHPAFKALGEPAAVALLYDAAEGIVALRKVTRSYANGYNVRKQANSQSYLVGAQGFTTFNKIATDVPRRFTGHDYGDQTWGFVLSEGSWSRAGHARARHPTHPLRRSALVPATARGRLTREARGLPDARAAPGARASRGADAR